MSRRSWGGGSLYYDSHHDLWVGQMQAGWNENGTRRRIRVASRDKATARKKLTDLRTQLEEGTWEQRRTETLLAAWCDKWLESRDKEVRPATLAIEQSAVRDHIKPLLGHKRISSLRPSDLRALGDRVMDAGKAPATAARYQAVLLHMLREAQREDIPVSASILAAKKQNPGRSNRQAIPLPDALKIIQAAAGIPGGVRWLLALLQGLRQAEALGLTWDMVDLETCTVTVAWQLQALPYLDKDDHARGFRVPRGYEMRQLTGAFHLVRTKTLAGERVLPLTPWVAGALSAWREQAPENPWGLLFTTDTGQPVSRHSDRRSWIALQETAGVQKPDGSLYVTHETRHTTATLLLAAGVEPEVIKAILGHSDIVTQATYQHVDMELARTALVKAQRLLTPTTSPSTSPSGK